MQTKVPFLIVVLLSFSIISCAKKTAIESETNNTDSIPTKYQLEQIYPNPMTPYNIISYSIPESTHVLIVVHKDGNKIADTVENQLKAPGFYKVEPDWSTRESGIYFYEMITEKFKDKKKMILLK